MHMHGVTPLQKVKKGKTKSGMIGSGCGGGEMSMKWRRREDFLQPQQRQQQSLNYFSDQLIGSVVSAPVEAQQFQDLVTFDDHNLIKQDPGLENIGWSDLGCTIDAPNALGHRALDFEMNYTVSAAAADAPAQNNLRDNIKKRKTEKNRSLYKAVAEDESEEKKLKGNQEEGNSKARTQETTDNKTKSNSKKEHSADNSKQTSKVTEDKKPDYIHVRARRGQATDSHSLAERVRREKISERMKYLQDLVPGCNKITGKAGMLDEIINYVQSLQKQVEFLSMKLAAVHPRLDFNIDNLFTKEMFQSCPSNFPPVGITSEMATSSSNLHFNLLQLVSSSGLEFGISPSDMALQRPTSAPASIPKTLLNSSSVNQIQTNPIWDIELQNLYAMEVQQGRLASFNSQPFMGLVEDCNPRMEI